MADRLSKEQRHRNMAAIRGRDTRPELIVRRFLWGHGYRYRLNHLRLPGKPDLVLRRFRTCIFVNGCFWHGHRLAIDEMAGEGTGRRDGEAMSLEIANSECCKVPKSNREFWVKKIVRNHERDREVQVRLSRMG